MIARIGESRQDRYTSGTYDGIFVNTYMVAKALNTQLGVSDFSPSQVNVKILLRRNQQVHTIAQDNLLLLATYWNLHNDYHEFLNGLDKKLGSATEYAVKLRMAKIPFGGPIRVDSGDELLIEVTPAQGSTFTGNVNVEQSYVEFYATPCIGYEEYLPITTSEVVQANTSKQSFNPGDNVLRLATLNFDKNDLTQEVISNFNLASDKLDLSFSFNQLLAHGINRFSYSTPSRYGTSLPIPAVGMTVVRGLDYLPQSVLIHAVPQSGCELDQVRVDISYNSMYVSSSQNYVMYTRFLQSARQVVEASKREQKHKQENLQKIKDNPVNV